MPVTLSLAPAAFAWLVVPGELVVPGVLGAAEGGVALEAGVDVEAGVGVEVDVDVEVVPPGGPVVASCPTVGAWGSPAVLRRLPWPARPLPAPRASPSPWLPAPWAWPSPWWPAPTTLGVEVGTVTAGPVVAVDAG